MEKVRKTKKVKYLPLYLRWIRKGMIPRANPKHPIYGGLCGFFYGDELFYTMFAEGQPINVYWASGSLWGTGDEALGFSELRQNIVLFLAAMNGEL